MTKLCSVCGTENREEAQFCRSCGTAFPPPAPAPEDESQLGAGIVCDECNFQNKPGLRYCANCGVSLLGTVIVPRSRSAPMPLDPLAGTSPPPISYPSYAPVAPYPPPPVETTGYPPVAPPSYSAPPLPAYDDASEISDPAAALAAMRHRRTGEEDSHASVPATMAPAPGAARPSSAPLIIGIVAALLVAGGAIAWWLMRGSGTPAPQTAASAPPIATPAPVPAPAPAVVEAASAVAAPVASAPEVAATPPAPVASPVETATTAPAVIEPAAPSASDLEAQRIAAEKRRERLAREKAEREAKAKALAEQQQQQAAAAARAEQEAARRRAAEEAQRAARPAPAPPPVAPPPVQVRSVREICAGRNTISEAICQSRECTRSEHANEAICKQIKEAEDRRRSYQN